MWPWISQLSSAQVAHTTRGAVSMGHAVGKGVACALGASFIRRTSSVGVAFQASLRLATNSVSMASIVDPYMDSRACRGNEGAFPGVGRLTQSTDIVRWSGVPKRPSPGPHKCCPSLGAHSGRLLHLWGALGGGGFVVGPLRTGRLRAVWEEGFTPDPTLKGGSFFRASHGRLTQSTDLVCWSGFP